MKEIKMTNNYSMFKKLKGNRDVEDDRIRKIINSINTVGYITSPILVNEKMEVIDGQGRLGALKELKYPVEYIVQEGLGIEECIAMNINKSNWKQKDFIDSYSENGNLNFSLIKSLIDKFPESNLDTICTALFKTEKAPNKSIIDGTLLVSNNLYNEAVKRLKYVSKLYSAIDKNLLNGSINILAQVLAYCYDYEEVDNDRLISQIQKYYNIMGNWNKVEQCIQEVEKIYNKNLKSEVYIYTLYRQEKKRRKQNSMKNVKRESNGSVSLKHPYANYNKINLGN